MIYVECNSDEALVSTLGCPRKEIEHSRGKGNVCNELKKKRNSKGLVDEDPKSPQPTYIRRLKLLSYKNGIKVLHDKRNQNYLIVLCPRLEEWVLQVARKVKVDVTDYSLPGDPDELHKFINAENREPREFVKLIRGMRKRGSRMLKTLEELIKSK